MHEIVTIIVCSVIAILAVCLAFRHELSNFLEERKSPEKIAGDYVKMCKYRIVPRGDKYIIERTFGYRYDTFFARGHSPNMSYDKEVALFKVEQFKRDMYNERLREVQQANKIKNETIYL